MSIPVLIIGPSGAGKSASLRNLDPNRVALINVLGKPLPFKGARRFTSMQTDNYATVRAAIKKESNRDIIVLDDVGYMMTNQFMRGHADNGSGNERFQFFNTLADNFWKLIEDAKAVPGDKRIYFIMHEEMNDFGKVKPKTVGKLIDGTVCIEGMFAICLRALYLDGKHIFKTQTDGNDVAKSPMGMFESEIIDNDLAAVDDAIVRYYEIGRGAPLLDK